jgi:hypothetical protein
VPSEHKKTCRWAGREKASYRSDKAVGVISSFEQFRGNSIPINLLSVPISVARFNWLSRSEPTLRALPAPVPSVVDAKYSGFPAFQAYR